MVTEIISSHGYRRIKCPDHPDADVAGYRYEHRLVAEKMMGRRLHRTELVHHINGDKLDNRPENLEIVSISWHKLRHRKTSGRRTPQERNQLIICKCGCGQSLLKFDNTSRPRQYIAGHSWRKGKFSYDTRLMSTCECGCGATFLKYDKWGRPRRFVSGHNALPM